ncbi:hypothetical protein SCHPADRAFT_992780 [Schizopora paradoxa]|uniref:F-box domain-containing protein n=1 Tax=Schizopora paradoxa TaxID=27342 RepID=A0A0H2SR52_9AGAM|nr:hypothetical protein SCHPADRAFT_992780 [Schizopora paradoxa]
MALLPDEIWQWIFYLATDHLARREWDDGPMEIPPFDIFRKDADSASADEALTVKVSIFLVCKKWQTLSAKFLFEDIRIRQGSYALAQKLEQPLIPSSDNTAGAYVRRIVIPVDMSGNWPKTLEANARRIMMACPNTLILARRMESFRARYARRRNFTKIAIDDVQMPRLRRVDWNNAPALHYDRGVQGFPTFIWSLPALEILSVSDYVEGHESHYGKRFPWCLKSKVNAMDSTSLSTIHTLRLESRVNNDFVTDVLEKRLLSVRHLIINFPQGHTFRSSLFNAIGPQLQVVELATRPPVLIYDLEFNYDDMFWKDILSACPNLRSFHSHILYFPTSTESQSAKSESLKELKLLMRTEDNDKGQLGPKKHAIYDNLLSTIKLRSRYPLLDRVELHGSGWSSIYKESLCDDLKRAAVECHVSLSFESVDL